MGRTQAEERGTHIVSDILHGSEILRADSKEMPEKRMYVLVAAMDCPLHGQLPVNAKGNSLGMQGLE